MSRYECDVLCRLPTLDTVRLSAPDLRLAAFHDALRISVDRDHAVDTAGAELTSDACGFCCTLRDGLSVVLLDPKNWRVVTENVLEVLDWHHDVRQEAREEATDLQFCSLRSKPKEGFSY